jgi:hypothetical protein
VLDDQVAADRLDDDHAATLLVSEYTSALVAFRARLVVAIREPEDPDIEVDFLGSFRSRGPYG